MAFRFRTEIKKTEKCIRPLAGLMFVMALSAVAVSKTAQSAMSLRREAHR